MVLRTEHKSLECVSFHLVEIDSLIKTLRFFNHVTLKRKEDDPLGSFLVLGNTVCTSNDYTSFKRYSATPWMPTHFWL